MTEAAAPSAVFASTLIGEPGAAPPGFATKTSGKPISDRLLHWAAAGSAMTIVLLLIGLLTTLTISALPSIRTFGFGFLVSSDWRPNALEDVPKRDAAGNIMIVDGEQVVETLPPSFGAAPVIYGTVVSSVIALVFAVPLSIGAALFLTRIATRALVGPASFLIEFLAAIPSIAYGLWGLFIFAPFLQDHIEPNLNRVAVWLETHLHTVIFKNTPLPWFSSNSTTGRDMFCGGLVLAIMIIPIITAISRDVLRGVPRAQVEGTTALGATWWQTSKEMLKYSRSGLFGAIMLGLARAAGETMAVAMVIGNNNQIKASLFAPAQTMSSLLANEFHEASSEIHLSALVEVALILLVMSLLFNVIARYLVVGKQARTAAAH